MQDRVGKLEGDKLAAKDKIETLENELAKTKELLHKQQQEKAKSGRKSPEPNVTFENESLPRKTSILRENSNSIFIWLARSVQYKNDNPAMGSDEILRQLPSSFRNKGSSLAKVANTDESIVD